MFQIYLHLTHQNVLQEGFKVQEAFRVFFISVLRTFFFFFNRNRKPCITESKQLQLQRLKFDLKLTSHGEYSAMKWIPS